MTTKEGEFTLAVTLDCSGVGPDAAPQDLKVVAQSTDGTLTSAPVSLKGDAGSATLRFADDPGPLRVLVGPAQAEDADLVHSQTISVDVTRQSWGKARKLTIPPIVISAYYWWWWWRWCREFTIRGRLLCADGSPVPGAEVCAYDVDWWFWWTSTDQVGCATTDINGAFQITFRRCCGLWPWWWWLDRVWEFDPYLAERINGVLEQDPGIALGRAKNQPTLDVFSSILAPQGLQSGGVLQATDVNRLEQLRSTLLSALPPSPELADFNIWPWAPWRPWWDCEPNIIFRATQNCTVTGAVVLDEGIAEARWDIPDSLDVTLTANDLACCVNTQQCNDGPCPEGECLVVTQLCDIDVYDVSGNVGAPTAPQDGLANPGAVTPMSAAWAGDRPFAGDVSVEYANIMTGVDYYEIEYATSSGGPWAPVPVAVTPTIYRQYIDTATMPISFPVVPFPFVSISGHTVVMSREYYQATSGWNPASDFWIGDQVLVVLDSTKIPAGDGTYWFRVVGYQINSGGNLINAKVLPVCDTKQDNGWVLTFDNPPAGIYPDAQILEVLIDGVSVDPCGVAAASGGTLEVVFVAEDPDGWLGGFSLVATYGLDGAQNLLTQPGSDLVSITADCVGPEYGQALKEPPSPGTPCATAPTWYGGQMSLTIPLDQAFPENCCYQINLNVWTRHILNCGGSPAPFQNEQWYTIGYGVCDPPIPVLEAHAVDA